MKRTLIIALAALLVIGLFATAYVLITAKRSQTTVPDSAAPTSFPSSGSSGVVSNPGSTVNVIGSDGSSIAVQNFVDNGTTIEDSANPGNYYLAGGNGVCTDDGNCIEGAPATDFAIVYFSEDNSFILSLTQEPLGDARRHAEQFLMQTLGISQASMCALNYYLSTDGYVSMQYAGTNLGFSFCEGATQLP